ncbi:hypothetical protein RB195_005102 [Necator americanus]|uniref:Uncharacterized protein n=1 Tax=Necator americanus TaxID=51031 RepID=A0ABR1BL67_NECAM
MTRGRYQHLALPSKVAEVNRLRFFVHILRRPADRLAQRILRSLSGSSRKKPPGRKRKFWTEVVKEDLRHRQFRRDVRFPKMWNSDEWIDSVQALAEDREGWAELCSRTIHLGEDAATASGDNISPPQKQGIRYKQPFLHKQIVHRSPNAAELSLDHLMPPVRYDWSCFQICGKPNTKQQTAEIDELGQ